MTPLIIKPLKHQSKSVTQNSLLLNPALATIIILVAVANIHSKCQRGSVIPLSIPGHAVTILKQFNAYRHLPNKKGGELYKTASLKRVRTQVGYTE